MNIQGFANQDVVEVLRNAGQVVHLTLVRRKTSSPASPLVEQPSDTGNGFHCPSPHLVVWVGRIAHGWKLLSSLGRKNGPPGVMQ